MGYSLSIYVVTRVDSIATEENAITIGIALQLHFASLYAPGRLLISI